MTSKEKILRSAIALIAKKGFYNTKTKEIAKKAKITEPTLYAYFSSKDNILAEIFERGWSKLDSAITNSMKNSDEIQNFWEKFETLLNTVLRFIQDNPDLSTLMLREYFRIDPRLKAKVMISLSYHKSVVNLITFFYQVYLKWDSIPQELETKILRNLLFTTFRFIIHVWGISEAKKTVELLYSTQESI